MPELVNRNAHGVRVYDDNGREHRLRAGEVRNVDGAAADSFSGLDGVDSASSDDKEAWDAQNSQMTGKTGKASMDEMVSTARVVARTIGVSVPLNTVIGDDDAPLGPPSGTITTKSAVASEGPVERGAFMDHERLPEEAENEKLSDVEREQAVAKARLEEVHQEILAAADKDDDDDDDGDSGKANQPPAAKPASRKPKQEQ